MLIRWWLMYLKFRRGNALNTVIPFWKYGRAATSETIWMSWEEKGGLSVSGMKSSSEQMKKQTCWQQAFFYLLMASFTWSIVSSSGLLSTKKTEISWKESSGGPQRWWRAWRTSLKRKGWATYQGRWVHCICAVYRALMKTILNPFLVYTYTDAFIKSD